jgi:hypothetical protein
MVRHLVALPRSSETTILGRATGASAASGPGVFRDVMEPSYMLDRSSG